jgi:hypothetical protein
MPPIATSIDEAFIDGLPMKHAIGSSLSSVYEPSIAYQYAIHDWHSKGRSRYVSSLTRTTSGESDGDASDGIPTKGSKPSKLLMKDFQILCDWFYLPYEQYGIHARQYRDHLSTLLSTPSISWPSTLLETWRDEANSIIQVCVSLILFVVFFTL